MANSGSLFRQEKTPPEAGLKAMSSRKCYPRLESPPPRAATGRKSRAGRKRSQGDAAKPARLGSKKEDLRSKVLLGRGCYHRPTVESFVALPDNTPPAWPGPVAAGRRGRLPH